MSRLVRPYLRRRSPLLAFAAAIVLLVPMLPAAPSAVAAPPTTGVTSPPVDQSNFGPVADWGSTTGTDGRVYMADQNGRALQLHGFNMKTQDPAGEMTDALLDQAAQRGLDHYRMSIYWQLLEPTKGNYNQVYLDNIVTAIKRCAAHGIRVILDMHQDVYGQSFGSLGIPTWATATDPSDPPFVAQPSWPLDYLQPAVQTAFDRLYDDPVLRQAQIDVWLKVVDAVKGLPGVLGYDLMNEPFGKIRPGEDLLSAAKRVESDQLTKMYQRLTDAIGAVDPAHWIFIEPPNLASLGIPTSLGKVNGPKVALYPHMYDTSLETSTYDPNSTSYSFDPNFFTSWADAITTYTAKYPIPMLIGEWGIARPEAHSMDEFVRQTLSTLDRVSSGWSQFVLCDGTSGYCSLDAEGNDKANIGQIFEPYARAIAGAPTASTYDFTTRTLRVTYRDNGATGATEIFIPESRAYPEGFQVTSDDATGTWSHTFDAATGVLSVTLPKTSGDHDICVGPAGSTGPCTAPATLPTTPPTTPHATLPAAPAATSPVKPKHPTPPATLPVAAPQNIKPTYTG